MTNLKKVLVFVVVFAMMLTFSVSALSFPDVDQSASYAESVSVLSSLGLMIGDEQGNFNPDKTITRAEAATIIVRAKGLEDAAAGAKGATQFTDVAADHWASGYINLACQNGIVAGYGDGTFGPEDEVTYEQITKMIVSALGYTPMANKQGGYPTGYLVIASQKGIAKGTNGQSGEPAPRATVARLLYNSLTVNMMEQTVYSVGAEEYGEVDKTLLYDYLDIDVYEGIVTATYATTPNTVDVNNKTITIEHDKFNGVAKKDTITAEEGNTNAAGYLGYYVVAYAADVDETDEYTLLAVAPKSNKNETVSIDYSQIDNVVYVGSDITRIDYMAKSTDRSATKLNLNDKAKYFYNGKEDFDNAEDFLGQTADAVKPGYVKFVDYNKDDEFDYVFITAYGKDYVVDEVNEAQQRLVDKDGANIRIDLDDEDVIYTFYKADGTPASFEDIKVNDVLTFAESDDSTLVAVYISDKVVEGTVSEQRKDGEDYYTIDGEEYRLSTSNSISVKVADEGKFYLNVDNRIVRKETDRNVSTDKYAYLYDAELTTGLGGDTVQIQCLTAAGEMKIFDLATKVTVYKEERVKVGTVDGVDKYEYQYNSAVVESAKAGADLGIFKLEDIDDVDDPKPTPVLFQYDINSSGKIHRIYAAAGNMFTEDGPSLDGSVSERTYDADTVRLGGTYLDKETIVFNVPAKNATDYDENDFTVSTVAKTFKESNSGYTADFYDIDDYPAIVVAYGAKGDIDDSTKLFVISKVTTGNNDNGTSVQRFYGYQEGEYVNAFASEDGVTVLVDGKESTSYEVKAGDVVIFSLDLKGDIDKIQVLMTADEAIELKEDQANAGDKTFVTGDAEEAANYFGWAKAKASNSRLTLQFAGDTTETIMFKGTYNVYNVNLNRSTPVVSVSSYGDIDVGENRPGRDTDYVFVRMFEGNVVDAVVYTFTLDSAK